MKFKYDGEAIDFLKSHGFILSPGYNWKTEKKKKDITEDEWEAMGYLYDEWDWGYYIEE